MKKYLIATHGKLAEGLKSSVRIIAGDYYADQINTVTAFLDASDFTQDIRKFVDELSDEDQGIIFTDLYGGSVNQNATLIKMESNKNVRVLTGTNLGMLMEVILNPQEEIDTKTIEEALEAGRNELSECPKKEEKDIIDEDFF